MAVLNINVAIIFEEEVFVVWNHICVGVGDWFIPSPLEKSIATLFWGFSLVEWVGIF